MDLQNLWFPILFCMNSEKSKHTLKSVLVYENHSDENHVWIMHYKMSIPCYRVRRNVGVISQPAYRYIKNFQWIPLRMLMLYKKTLIWFDVDVVMWCNMMWYEVMWCVAILFERACLDAKQLIGIIMIKIQFTPSVYSSMCENRAKLRKMIYDTTWCRGAPCVHRGKFVIR